MVNLTEYFTPRLCRAGVAKNLISFGSLRAKYEDTNLVFPKDFTAGRDTWSLYDLISCKFPEIIVKSVETCAWEVVGGDLFIEPVLTFIYGYNKQVIDPRFELDPFLWKEVDLVSKRLIDAKQFIVKYTEG